MEAVLREIAQYDRELRRLAKAEQKAAANLANRYARRRGDAWVELSAAARRLIEAMQETSDDE